MTAEPLGDASAPALLDDEAVRTFIANGFLRLAPDVPAQVHAEVDAALRQACEHEAWYGNNILARVPQMHAVLDCPVVRGAVTSLAGAGYYLHPHCAVHTSTPANMDTHGIDPAADGPPMGKGSRAGSGWHQDAQSPLSRARHHVPRYLIGFYFPHETPLPMGPTRMQAGSHLFANPVALGAERPGPAVVFEAVPAGSFFLVHFDMVHAGFPNRTDHTRYMVKFVFVRTRRPAAPSWRNASREWSRPAECRPAFDLPATWGHIWRWMRGEQPPCRGADAAVAQGQQAGASEPARLERIYAGGVAPAALADALLACAGRDKHQRCLAQGPEGVPMARDDTRGYPRRWNERAVVMEDAAYALAACGEAALATLHGLAAHDDPWVRINAAFALGEIGASASAPALVPLLDSRHQQVVRQALDALGAIGVGLAPALPRIARLLAERNGDWQEEQVLRGWTGEDQVRLNAALALLAGVAANENHAAIEPIAAAALGDKNGYVSAVATEILIRIGTLSAQRAALRFLAERRWDDTLRGRAKAY